MAFFRALESARPAGSRLFSDPFATLFLTPGLRLLIALSPAPVLRRVVPAVADAILPGARSSAVARTRLIDDVLSAAAPDVEQVVVLGAGYDCRPYRLPALDGLPVFEIDHPDTLARRRRALDGALPARTSRVRSVAVDFDRTSAADALPGAGFDAHRRTFFLWEGVTNYLTPPAVDATFRWLGGAAPGSVVAFTYVERRVLEDPDAFYGARRLLRAVERLGEPWTFGLDPAEAAGWLRARGLTLVEDLGATEYRRRCLGERRDGTRGYEFYRVALARVGP